MKQMKQTLLEVTTYSFINPYIHTIDTSKPSKSRLKKCEKGLHEFISKGEELINEYLFKEEWSCKHCGQNIDRTKK